MLTLLDQAALSYQVVLTKRDEVKKSAVGEDLADARGALRKHPAAHPDVIFLSSHTGEGIGDLRATIARLISERDRETFARLRG